MRVFLRPFNRPSLVSCWVIAAVILILYSVAFGHNFLFDEENIILRNPYIRSLSLIPELFKHGYFYFEGRSAQDWAQYYRPLASLTFAIDHFFWKYNPLGYNLTNTFLHVLASILLFFFLLKVFKNQLVAFLCALLYSVHPLHTEAVTYVASRGDLLGGSLMLAAFLSYWEKRTGLAVLWYASALFCKENSLLLPLYLFLLDISFIKSDWKGLFRKLFPFCVIAVLFIVFRKFFSPIALGPPSLNVHDAALRVFSMGDSVLRYFEAFLFPEEFKFCLAVNFKSSFSDPAVMRSVQVYSLLGAAWLLTLRRRSAAFFGMSLFLTSLFPYLNFIHFYPEWAEHYLYVPSIGLFVLLGVLMTRVFEIKHKRAVALLFAVYGVFFLFFCQRTWQRNKLYNDTEGYYKRLSASDSPYAFFGYQNLARLSIEKGDWSGAMAPLRAALLMEPDSDVTQHLLGQCYMQKGLFSKAVIHFENAYRLSNGYDKYRMSAGIAYTRMGEHEKALGIFEDIQKKSPDFAGAYTNLITAYELAGKPDKALAWGMRGLEKLKGRNNDSVILTMAVLRMAYREGRMDVAKGMLNEILQKYPDAFWYGDIARLLAGQISGDEFLRLVDLKYAGFEGAAKMDILIALVLQDKKEALRKFMETHRLSLEKEAQSHPLLKRELERAKTSTK